MRVFFLVGPIVLTLSCLSAASAQSSHALSSNSQRSAAEIFDDGQNAQQRGDLHSAVKLYTAAVSSDPSLYQAYYQRGTALLGLGRESEAEADFKKVIELEPKFARAHRAIGQ